MNEKGWSYSQVDELDFNHYMEILEFKERKAQEERELELKRGAENIMNLMGG